MAGVMRGGASAAVAVAAVAGAAIVRSRAGGVSPKSKSRRNGGDMWLVQLLLAHRGKAALAAAVVAALALW